MLFLELHISGTIFYFVWLLSLRITNLTALPVLACNNCSFLVGAEYYSIYRYTTMCLPSHLLIDIIIPNFSLLEVNMLGTFLCKSVCH